ncbi:MAG TPA: PEP-CTERM sorting domain-containing protein [Myxococcota bacterium]|nr:PEP-CTERM sorting domain-containing protein [Myxococcota bacterium]
MYFRRSWTMSMLIVGLIFGVAVPGKAGNVFLSGHDPDFHALNGANALGAQDLIDKGLDFVRNGNAAPILLLESGTDNIALGDHSDSEQGLIASGYTSGSTPGNHYVKVSAAQFATANLSLYSAVFVPSDHGGTLTGSDLATLDGRAADIAAYLAAGGGLIALAEDGNRVPAPTNPQPQNFAFLPFSVTSGTLEQPETGYTLSPFGASLGLAASDINGNASHSFFSSTGGLSTVDVDAAGNIISIAGAVVPEPSTALLLSAGVLRLAVRRRKARDASLGERAPA